MIEVKYNSRIPELEESYNEKETPVEVTSLDILKAKHKELSELMEIIDSNEELKKQYSFLSMGVSRLIEWIIDSNQLELNDPCDEVKLTTKVVKFHGYVDKAQTDREGVDLLFCGGIFLKAPVYILPADKVNKIWEYRYGCINQSKVEEVGLPPASKANYGTIRQYDQHKYLVIAKDNSYVSEMIYTASRYEIVYIQ